MSLLAYFFERRDQMRHHKALADKGSLPDAMLALAAAEDADRAGSLLVFRMRSHARLSKRPAEEASRDDIRHLGALVPLHGGCGLGKGSRGTGNWNT